MSAAMLPADLKPEQFQNYPPGARKLALAHLDVLRLLPASFVPSLLREVIDYDYRFPAERRALERELNNLDSLSAGQREEWFAPFSGISLSPALLKLDWVDSPAQFVEELSAHLWTTHQLDAFRSAAMAYADRLQRAIPPEPPPAPRLGISIIGQGVTDYDGALFRKLKEHGALFTNVKPENGLSALLGAVAARAKAHPENYAHWYIDGGEAAPHDAALTTVAYGSLDSARAILLKKIGNQTQRPGMGPENLRSFMARIRPEDLGISSGDAVLDRFRLKILTEGSGTQIFSTTFAQWSAREALRRAQPLTLLVRFAPRQKQKPMSELLSEKGNAGQPELDPLGSLVDADMGAYYNWLNQQRLTGAEQSAFLVWFESHREAVAISPAMPRGTQSANETDLEQILKWML